MPTPDDLQLRREDCRRAVRAYLYARQAVAQSPATITRGLGMEHDFSLAEVTAALRFLVDLGQLKIPENKLGASEHFQINAAGILAEERGQ
jgi:hypothetical protein